MILRFVFVISFVFWIALGLSWQGSFLGPFQAQAFTPLDICPGFEEGSEKALADKLKQAFLDQDLPNIETYLALTHCRLGAPHSKIPERYVVIQKTPDPSILAENRLELIKQFWQRIDEEKENLDSQLQDNRYAAEKVEWLTSLLKAALLTREIASPGKAYMPYAENAAKALIQLLESNELPYVSRAYAALALMDLYDVTQEKQYLKAADDIRQGFQRAEMTPDFMRNAAIAAVLARSARIREDQDLLNKAHKWLWKGSLSGMIDSGANAGNFIDPYTQYLENRYRLTGLVYEVYEATPDKNANKQKIRQALSQMGEAVFKQFRENKGIQAGDWEARFLCHMAALNFKAELKDAKIKETKIKDRQDLLKWYIRMRNFMLADMLIRLKSKDVREKESVLTSPYSIICMLNYDIKS